jgi:putative transposase
MNGLRGDQSSGSYDHCIYALKKGGVKTISGRRDAARPRLTLEPMTLFRNKYRVESARKPHWDYTLPGWYFVTICTQNRRSYFGRVVQEAMNLSVLGEYASQCWQEIPTHHVNVAIDEFIVMPNHVHGIIVISGPEKLPPMGKRNEIRRIPALAEIHPKAGSLGAVVGSFKSAVSSWCTLRELTFA